MHRVDNRTIKSRRTPARRKLRRKSDQEVILAATRDKQIIKDAINEWMDNKFSEFGKWSFYGFMAMCVGALGYLILYSNGWHK